MDHLHHPLRWRHKVRVEDGDKLPLRDVEPLIQRTRLVPVPIRPVQVDDGLPLHSCEPSRIPLHNLPCHPPRLISRIIEQLNFKPVSRILQAAHRFDQAVNHKLLVVDRQLDRHKRKFTLGKSGRWLVPLRSVLLVFVVEPDQLIAMKSVEGQDDHHDEVRNQQTGIERVPAIEMLKSLIGIVRLPVVAEALGRKQ